MKTRAICVEMDSLDYQESWVLQQKIVAARTAKSFHHDVIFVLEHPPVFTLGRHGRMENLGVSEAMLEKTGIPVIRVERGGDITYHGPGQVVVYPIIDLYQSRRSVTGYVWALEEIMIRTAEECGVTAKRSEINRGVWAGARKLGSVGIALRRGVAFHGFALNVSNSLDPFSWIHPCGLKDVEVTSLSKELNRPLSIAKVREMLKKHTSRVLGVTCIPEKLPELLERVDVVSS